MFAYNTAPRSGDLNFTNLNELTAAINNHLITGGAVTAFSAGTNPEITASRVGTSRNATIVVGIGGALGGLVVDITAGANKIETSKASGKVLEAESKLQFSLVCVEAKCLMPANQVSLAKVATVFSDIYLSDKLNSADTESNISTNVLEQINTSLEGKERN
jgi:hypothetical protein